MTPVPSTDKRHFVYDHQSETWLEPSTGMQVAWFGCPVWAWLRVNFIEPDYWLGDDGKLHGAGN